MSSPDEWDQELEVVAREIETVRAAHGRSRLSENRTLIARKISIIQAQINLERSIERIKKLTGRDYLLLPREKTLLYWGQAYVDKLQATFATQSKLLTKSLWLKLIKTRIAGPDAKPATDIDPDDLVALAIRQQSLQKTEQFLTSRLVTLRAKKKDLVRRYEDFGIAEANRTASGCLAGRLGATPEDALHSPTMKALALYVQQLAAILREDDEPALERVHRKLEKKAARLVDEAKDMVIGAARSPSAGPGVFAIPSPDRALSEFQMAMLELSELEAETREAYDSFLHAAPAEARPQVVAKRQGPRKTQAFAEAGKGK